MKENEAALPQARVRWAAVVGLTCLSGGIWLARAALAGPRLSFLWWNLFLAWIPWLLTSWLRKPRGTFLTVLIGAAWFVFFPNAPYLVTDLVHLKPRAPVPLPVDLMLFASFGLTGLALGWTSLDVVRQRLEVKWGRWPAAGLIALYIGATGFGVYLGRFLRWNSWDVVTNPAELLDDARVALGDLHAIAFSAAFAGLVGAGYLLVADPLPRLRRQ
jgi:uncharacterized membrane protein